MPKIHTGYWQNINGFTAGFWWKKIVLKSELVAILHPYMFNGRINIKLFVVKYPTSLSFPLI